MNKEQLKKIISQIKKYNLTTIFDDSDNFNEWLLKLNSRQIKNFNELDINIEEIQFPLELLINDNLLNCDDYQARVAAMATLKNGEGCWHLFDALCSKNFLKSKKYYQDIEMISKAETARYALWVINKDSFINSKYHDEDLKLIVEAKDTKDSNDWLVAESLATVAENIDSINSPYHQKDMELIANSGSKYLQMTGAYPERGLNKLAVNKVSLNDKYHLENMQILSNDHISNELLYNLMINKEIINGKYYREEVDALKNAKSDITANAIYYYITNPKEVDYHEYMRYYLYYGFEITELNFLRTLNRDVCIKGNLNPNYLEYLKLLNQIDDKFVLYFESLLSNKFLFTSSHQKSDLELLLTVDDVDVYMDLYAVMSSKESLNSPYHKHDVEIISKTKDKYLRNLLVTKAVNKYSLSSLNHLYDMAYISKLDLHNLNEYTLGKLRPYLFDEQGINSKEHINVLETLSRGEVVEENNLILEYLDELEKGIENNAFIINNKPNNPKGISRVLKKCTNFLKKSK